MTQVFQQRRASCRLLLITLWTTLLLLAVEVIAGWIHHSLSLWAESLHTLLDSFSVILSLMAVASPQRILGREIWGHGRIEVVVTLLLCAFMGFVCPTLGWMALQQLQAELAGTSSVIAVEINATVIQILTAMVVVVLVQALFCSYKTRTFKSMALRLNTQHILQDAWLTLGLIAGLIGMWRGLTWLDPLLAVVLVAMAIRSLWRVLNAQLPMLLRPTAIAPEAISQIVHQVEGVTQCTRILSRGMVSRQVWVELHLSLHPDYTGMAQHIGEQIEAELRKRYGPLRAKIFWGEATPPLARLHHPFDAELPDSPPPDTSW